MNTKTQGVHNAACNHDFQTRSDILVVDNETWRANFTVSKSVRQRWVKEAKALGIPKREQELMRPAFSFAEQSRVP